MAHKKVECNRYHSGNRRIEKDGKYYQCQGCGQFTPAATVAEIAKGKITGYTGAGGCARVQ